MKQPLRNNLRKYSSGSVFWKLLTSIVIPACCSLIILSCVFIPFLISFVRDIDTAREENLLKNVADHLDKLESTAQSAAESLRSNNWLFMDVYVPFQLQKQTIGAESKETIQEELYTFVMPNIEWKSISLCFFGTEDVIYSSYGVYENATYLREYAPESLRYMFLFTEEGFSTMETGTDSQLIYYLPLRFSDNGIDRGGINVVFNTDRLKNTLLRNTDSNAVSVRILDQQDTVLWRYDTGVSGSKTVTLRTTAASGQFIYEVDVPVSFHQQTRGWLIPVICLVILLDMLVCAVTAGVLSQRNYRPIEKLHQKISAGSSNINEFHALDQFLDETTLELDQLKRELELTQQVINQNMIRDLISGRRLFSEVSENSLSKFRQQPSNSPAAVLAVYAPLPRHQRELFISQLEELPDSFAGRTPCVNAYAVANGEEEYRIVINYSEPAELELYLQGLEHLLSSQSDSNGESRFFIGMGGIVDTMDELSVSATQSINALNYARTNDIRTVCRYPDIDFACKYNYPLSLYLLLFRAVQQRNLTDALELLDEIIGSNRNLNMSISALKMLTLELASTVLRSQDRSDVEKTLESLNRVRNTSLDDVQAYIRALIEDVCHDIPQNVLPQDQQILEYVDRNVFSSDLSADSVAVQFQKSQSSISRIYKKYKNTSFTDYVNHARILRAIELLCNEGMCMDDVMVEVGYTNMTSFRRNFIKYTNKTPSELIKSKKHPQT